ncbi:MAG: 4-hydroxy-3-methylbut-2-enyl diphosphate reductase [Chitinophagaceae bacterium]|nr:MAG: 4-hydroxy-3-methylbut-2-enyl diphosphate reductase [Chitinophagaceae bacterium]
MKQFDVPIFYRSSLISSIKKSRKEADRMKKDFTPTLLDFGPIQIYLARHFGFCYGVENAIEIAFRTIEENPGKRIYLLSEIIHNPQVNKDLTNLGVRFLQDNFGNQLVPYETITKDDIVLIPAFGTTLTIEKKLREIGISIDRYNTTCPFVEKVWNRSAAIAAKNYTIVIHGKPTHEETRATFSHAKDKASAVVVKDMQQTVALAKYITKEKPAEEFYTEFKGQYSEGFDVEKDLERIGVVNQTTMLASDTQDIADYLKTIMTKKYLLDEANVHDRFADTKDTLCYATNDNQTSIYGMLNVDADLAIVVGGYNSSNTSHLVELCEEKLPTYFINNEQKLISKTEISHCDFHNKKELTTHNYLPEQKPVKILMSSGASCPDKIVEQVIEKLISFYPDAKTIDQIIEEF